MIIKISNLNEGVYEFTFEKKVDSIELEKPFWGKFKSLVKLNKLHDQLIVDVSSTFKVKYQCDRCGTDYNSKLISNYETVYLMNESPVDSDSIYVSYLSRTADKIDLKSDVREFALLAIPMKKLCKEDCKGLCYKCGTDLNKDQCNCNLKDTDPRWKPLLEIKDKLNFN